MGRRYQYNMTAERLKELYDTEMPDEAKYIWSEFLVWLVSYFHCSKQLADIRLREFSREYNIHPMKSVGLTAINKSTKGNDKLNYSRRKSGTKCFDRNNYMIGTTIPVCDQCKLLDACIADVFNCRYICLNCHEFNTTKDVNRFYKFRR